MNRHGSKRGRQKRRMKRGKVGMKLNRKEAK